VQKRRGLRPGLRPFKVQSDLEAGSKQFQPFQPFHCCAQFLIIQTFRIVCITSWSEACAGCYEPMAQEGGRRASRGNEVYCPWKSARGRSGEDQQDSGWFVICRILQIANFGKMPDAWKRAGAFEERTISGNQWAIELHGECQERGVVKRKVKLLADSRCAL
jgi:hypothetical protein